LPTTQRGTAKVSPGLGVKINYIFYWCDAFRNPQIEKTQVPVRYDPHDASRAYAFVDNRWIECVSDHHSTFHGRSEQEIKLASEELRGRCKQHSKESHVTARKLADLLRSVETEEKFLAQRLRDKANEEVLEVINGSLTHRNNIDETQNINDIHGSVDATDDSPNDHLAPESVELYGEF
jgi:putative transposase